MLKRVSLVAVVAMLVLAVRPPAASAQDPTSVGHPTDGWSQSCSSESQCDAWYQWHMKCEHVMGRSRSYCQANFPGAAPMALTPVTVAATMMSVGMLGGAALALAQDASQDPNAPLDQAKSTPYLTYIAGGAGVGLACAGLGLLMTKAPKKATAIGGVGAFMAWIGYMGSKNAEKQKPLAEQQADEESGKTQRDAWTAAALVGGVSAGLTAAAIEFVPKLTPQSELSVVRRLRGRYPALRRASLGASLSPFGTSRIEVTIR